MHYTTLVIGARDEDAVAQMLAPYLEYIGYGEPDKRFTVFWDMEDNLRAQYETETEERIIMPDGRLLSKRDEEFLVPDPDVLEQLGITLYTTELPEDLERCTKPVKELYKTFEEFAGTCSCRDPLNNRYGMWCNPNGKFDGWAIGGRWSPFFRLKKGRKGMIGQPGPFGRARDDTRGRADQTLKRDIDFEAMRSEAAERAERRYDAVAAAIKGTPKNESRDMIYASYEKSGRGDKPWGVELARMEYRDQPRVRAFIKFAKTEEGQKLLGCDYQVEDFDMTRAEYIRQKRDAAIATQCVLMDEEWYDRDGREETWCSMFAKIIDELPDDEILTVVDCHL